MLYLKKTPGGIIILHLCTKNLSDTIYSFWDKECDRLKLIIMGYFLPFYPSPLKHEKSEFWKNEKKLLEISSFYTCVPKVTIIYEVRLLRYIVGQTESFVISGHFLLFYRP